jgi:dTDP-4-amino-4,6-dideoxygalactose transaminase
VFCDIDEVTWTLCPKRLEELLAARAAAGALPKAVMPVDLYGSCADHEALGATSSIC